MNKSRFAAILFTLSLAAAPAWAQTDQPAPSQDQAPAQGMARPGCRMMGGSGMGMGPGMMGGMGQGMMGGGMGMGHGMMGGMGHGMMGGGMGMQACMMGDCWQEGGMGMGRMGAMQNCPGPRKTVKNAFRELKGYRMHADALGLNEAQQQRLDAIEETLTTAAIKTRADLQIAAIDLRRAMAQPDPDVAKAGNVIDRMGQMWTSMQKAGVKAVADARKVLTAEQKQKARQMPAQAGPMMMQMQPMPMEQEGGMMDHGMDHGNGM